MKPRAHLILALLLSLFSAHAGELIFTIQAYGIGWLGDDSFAGQAITFSGAGDTSNVVRTAGGEYRLLLAPGSATVGIAGIGTAQLDIGSAYIFANPAADTAGFGVGIVDTLAISNASFSKYDLSWPIGPLVGPAYGPIMLLSTSMGPLDLQYVGPAPYGSFQAAPAPEPPSAVLSVLSLFLFCILILRRCFSCHRAPSRETRLDAGRNAYLQ
jgi:hypothetical protein